MDAKHFESLVRDALGAKPFRSFIIELDDGQRLRVKRREALMYGRHTSIFFGANDLVQMFDHRAVIDVRQPAKAAAS
jgi:hypothetical protein